MRKHIVLRKAGDLPACEWEINKFGFIRQGYNTFIYLYIPHFFFMHSGSLPKKGKRLVLGLDVSRPEYSKLKWYLLNCTCAVMWWQSPAPPRPTSLPSFTRTSTLNQKGFQEKRGEGSWKRRQNAFKDIRTRGLLANLKCCNFTFYQRYANEELDASLCPLFVHRLSTAKETECTQTERNCTHLRLNLCPFFFKGSFLFVLDDDGVFRHFLQSVPHS